MARATRSTTSHVEKTVDENENPSGTPPPESTKLVKQQQQSVNNKKRKRAPGADSDDLPTAKQTKNNEDGSLEKTEELRTEESGYPPLAGDLPMTDEDAKKILEILEMADTQGLLDRVFPLDDVLHPKPSSSPSSSKSTSSDSYSLRTLLKESKDHSLRIFRSAIKQLHPISSQPRARISPPAAQQLRFCQLALSLIEQASRRNIDGLSLKPELILPDRSAEEVDEKEPGSARRKFALVQRLPTGDLWTSLDSDLSGSDSKPLSELSTGHAELVAILPSSSSSKPIPTLGDLHADKKLQTRYKPPTTRHISCGSFLNYGPYTSFAPAFDNDGGDVGRIGVSNVLWRRHEKGKAREKARILGDRLRSKLAAAAAAETAQAADSMQVDEVAVEDLAEVREAERRKEAEKRKGLLEKLFAPEESEALQKALDTLECEENVGELLARNAKALVRLQELQKERLRGENGASNDVQVGSEEWNLAHMIMDSLTLLASLRPRKPDGTASAIVPPVEVLRVLQQTLPSEPSQGWQGTLAESRVFAVRDDMTLRVKGPLEAQPPATATTTSTAPPAATAASTMSVAQTPAPTYSGYSYAGFSQHYRTPYPTQTQGQGQGSGYFATPQAQSVGTPQAQAQKVQQTNPYQSHFGGSAASQYPYGSWYPGQATATAAGTNVVGSPTPSSRKGTPQPTTASYTPSSTYMPYSTALAATTAAATTGAGTPARAVANTVATATAAKPQVNGWSTTPLPGAVPGTPTPSGGAFATLPPHLRPAVAGGMTPGSPLASSAAAFAQSYMAGGGYQVTPSPANT